MNDQEPGRAHRALLSFAWRALGRRKAKTFALAGGLSMTAALLAGVLFVTGSLRTEADRGAAVEPDLVVEHMVGGRPGVIDGQTLSWLTKLPGVRRLRPRVWGYVFVAPIQANVTVVGRDPDDPERLTRVNGALASGRDAAPGERATAVLGASLARVLHVGEEDLIALPSARDDAPALRVVGTFASEVSLYTSDVVLVDERDARTILDYPDGAATDVAIDLANPAEAQVVARAVTERLPGARVLDKRLLLRTHALTYGRRAGIVLAGALPALLSMLVLAWDRVSGLGPAEKRTIALQKAVGWSTADVLYAKLYELVLVGGVATAAGLVASYLWVFLLGAPGLREVLAGWSVLYPEVPLVPAVDITDIGGVLVAVLCPFVALGVVPAWRAAILDPMEAMRS